MRLAVLVALVLAPGAAWAQHDHGHHEAAPASRFSASLGVIAASYESMFFTGDYQGLVATGRWSRGRFAASLGVTGYRLDKNGKAVTGLGDLMLHGHATLLHAGRITAGAVAMVMAPTGDHDAGLGMGHVMLMPGGWIHWAPGRLALAASAGYARGLGGGNIHAEHGGGAWPLVDPMTPSELTLGASAMVSLASALRAGIRADAAIPTGGEDVRGNQEAALPVCQGPRPEGTCVSAETARRLSCDCGVGGDPRAARGVAAHRLRQ
jgi:hypothetical protein